MLFAVIAPLNKLSTFAFTFKLAVIPNTFVLFSEPPMSGTDCADGVEEFVTVNEIGTQKMQQVTAKGTGFTISGQEVAGLDDFSKLILDVQTLAGDVAERRATLNFLIRQLKGR